MQKVMQEKQSTIGEILFELALATDKESKNVIRDRLEKLISKYPNEKNILNFFVKEAFSGKTSVTLSSGVLAPDFTEEKITSKVDNGHTIVSWNNK